MHADEHYVVNLWYPSAGARGLYFARGRLRAADLCRSGGQPIFLVHSPPALLTVEVYTDAGKLVAQGQDLQATDNSPMAHITIQGQNVRRKDVWPSEEALGRLMILPGAEIGKLVSWWHADDRSAWRWQLEFYNHR